MLILVMSHSSPLKVVTAWSVDNRQVRTWMTLPRALDVSYAGLIHMIREPILDSFSRLISTEAYQQRH